MQQFNKISLYSNIIKNLLATTYLPLVRSVREGDYMCKDRLYIFKCEFVKCTKSGFVGSAGYITTEGELAQWTSLREFHFGEMDDKLSTNYISNCEGYDYRTHERLGQYLRNLRDMYGLNLLPLYNCFSNQPLENHVIRGKKVRHTSEYTNTKVYKVPIKFNQDYTICIENIGRTTIAPAFLRHNNLVKQNNTQYGNGIDITNQYISLHVYDNIHNFVNTSFAKPIKVRFDNYPHTKDVQVLDSNYVRNRVSYKITEEMCSRFAAVENTLYMLIQVPKVFNQNIVILEGDYTNLDSQKIVGLPYVDRLPDFLYDKYYIHDLNLMTTTTEDIRPFSPVLIEFLLWNAMCTLDTINNDFDRLAMELSKQYVPNTEDFTSRSFPNFWTSRYRQILSDYVNYSTTNIVQDNLGYATTAFEEYLNKNIRDMNPLD